MDIDALIDKLQIWRNEDHEDTTMLHRNEVIALLNEIEHQRGRNRALETQWKLSQRDS